MAANVETMFYVREKPWHGLGVRVEEAVSSDEALNLSGLNWKVLQKPIYTNAGELIDGYKANVRDFDSKVLGVVTDRYKVIQNVEAFEFTDALLGEGVRYETAGSLQEGKKVWLLARLPREYIIGGERISPYLVFSNTHDGSGAVKVAVTPIRVLCNNTLNLAPTTAKRSWSMIHTGNIQNKIQEAKSTLMLAETYMDQHKGGLHILRRTFATNCYRAGGRMKDVAAYIGDLTSTAEKYYVAARNRVDVDGSTEVVVNLPIAKKTATEKLANHNQRGVVFCRP